MKEIRNLSGEKNYPREDFNKEIENIKKAVRAEKYNNQNENAVQGMNSRLEAAEEWISELEVRAMESNR